jgi:hypothetical protein
VDAAAVLRPSAWGRYTFDGQQGEMLFSYQGHTTFPFARGVANKLTIVTTGTPHEFTPQPSVDGWRFEGAYELRLLTGEAITLSLSTGGQFVDRGALKYLDRWIYPFRVSDQPGDGTYSVTDFTIGFRYADGRTLRLPFSGLGITPGDPSPANIALGTEDDLLTLTTPGVPRLTGSLEPGTPTRSKLRWPATAPEYVLEATASLSARAWAPVLEGPVVEGTEKVVRIDAKTGARFFQLVKR